MQFIENRPISCSYCGYGPVSGVVESTSYRGERYNTCTWTCPRCTRMIRRDEQKIEDNNQNER